MNNTILVTGSTGLVGSRFIELFPNKSLLLTPDEHELDLTDSKCIKKYFQKNNIVTVVNFAAYTDVGEAEKQRGEKDALCWQVNVTGVGNLIDSIDPVKTHLIHISTDMVFPGSVDDPGPYLEDHMPEADSSKITWYGFSKAEAEKFVIEKLGKKATILRLIYPVRAKFAGKLDYLRKPLKLFDEGKLYPMFTDQQVSIAFIDEIAVVLTKIVESHIFGTYHVSSCDTSTPYDLVTYLLETARKAKNVIEKTSLDEFLKTVDNPVRYPKFGGLKVEKTQEVLGVHFSSWKEIIDKLVVQGITY